MTNIDCDALQEQYDAVQAAYIKLISGKRLTLQTSGDMTSGFAQVSLRDVKLERDQLAARLNACCGIDVLGEIPRTLTPLISNGRCTR